MVLRKSKKREEDFLDCTFARGRVLKPLPPYEEFLEEEAAKEKSKATLRKATSMLEFGEIRDIVAFGDDADALSDLTFPEGLLLDPAPADDVAGFFIDASDNDEAPPPPPPPVPDGVAERRAACPEPPRPAADATGGRPRGMHRVLSAASLAYRGLSSSLLRKREQRQRTPRPSTRGAAPPTPPRSRRRRPTVAGREGPPAPASSLKRRRRALPPRPPGPASSARRPRAPSPQEEARGAGERRTRPGTAPFSAPCPSPSSRSGSTVWSSATTPPPTVPP